MSPKHKAYLGVALFVAVGISLFVGTQIYYRRKANTLPLTQVIQTTETPAPTAASPATDTSEASPIPSVPVVAVVSNFSAATTRNADLMNNLDWSFGGKSQRGWYLYAPLIEREIGTEKNPDDEAFSVALAAWQLSAKLNPDGVLDAVTWPQMFGAWQARRLKDHTPAAPDQLMTAPTTDFYDPSRPDALRKVEPQTYAAYKRMIKAAAIDPSLHLATTGGGDKLALASSEKFLKIVSAFRSREYQDGLRKASPNSGRAGLAVNSPHFTGRAIDFYLGGDPVSTDDANRLTQTNTPVYRWLVKNADKFGFRPYFYEPWHWEYVGEPAIETR